MFEMKSVEFSGPLDKLLELIEGKKMDITRISLAEVTADFLTYLKDLTQANQENKNDSLSRIIADFLVVASQLILIKSKAILPEIELSEEEEESIQDLEKRLELYNQIKPMLAVLKKSWKENSPSFSREMFSSIQPVFYPPLKISINDLKLSLQSLVDSLGSFILETEKIERQIFTLEEKVAELSQRITDGISKFSQVISKKSRQEAIVMFLALLHLLRDQVLRVKQSEIFKEIELERV
ncbi:MAG: segregation/condensation protein A [Candidatus Paceibacterota bacterium]|jgi:segregation and condensation protein A